MSLLAYSHGIGHLVVRAGMWTAVRRVVDRLPLALLVPLVVGVLAVVVLGWLVRLVRRHREL